MMGQWIPEAVLIGVAATAAVTDLRTQRVPNWLTLPAVAAGFVLWAAIGALSPDGGIGHGLQVAGLGFLVGFVPLFVAFVVGGVHGGDVKLAAAIGALAGPVLAASSLFYGFLLAAVLAIFVMVRRRIVRQTAGRIWKVLQLAAMGARPASPTDAKSPHIANALPWAIGVIWAVAEQELGGSLFFWLIQGWRT